MQMERVSGNWSGGLAGERVPLRFLRLGRLHAVCQPEVLLPQFCLALDVCT